jgi:acetyl esterase/lipase
MIFGSNGQAPRCQHRDVRHWGVQYCGAQAVRRQGGPTEPRDVLTRPAPPPDAILRYGPGEDHVADLRLPARGQDGQLAGARGVPLVLFLHGGFWRAAYDRTHTGPLASALAAEGFAVCAPEYRRTGQRDGGWPGTFDDVAAAVDVLPDLARAATDGAVDSGRVLFSGHSAGGHLALWAAARHRLPGTVPWRSAAARCAGVVVLAAVSDLVDCYQRRLGNGAVADLLGGGPGIRPDRYAVTDPTMLIPAGVPVRLVHGSDDDVVPCQMSLEYAVRARAAGDDAACTELSGTGHFAVIDPLSDAWGHVVAAFRELSSPEGAVGPAPGPPR